MCPRTGRRPDNGTAITAVIEEKSMSRKRNLTPKLTRADETPALLPKG